MQELWGQEGFHLGFRRGQTVCTCLDSVWSCAYETKGAVGISKSLEARNVDHLRKSQGISKVMSKSETMGPTNTKSTTQLEPPKPFEVYILLWIPLDTRYGTMGLMFSLLDLDLHLFPCLIPLFVLFRMRMVYFVPLYVGSAKLSFHLYRGFQLKVWFKYKIIWIGFFSTTENFRTVVTNLWHASHSKHTEHFLSAD